ncbi:hypothetical protein LCGC14_1489920 [marine sediment metagenome]|uniref:DUF4112 domain-containing protein n=1 Tax=marine sediment metagenome TaxID=412755 RepID=A0A0F9M8V4_9ZZZZ|nr:DUF4112 domain-containing protein [Methylophaga sp.]
MAEPSENNLKKQSWLSWLLDESITLPGGYKIGLDGVLGLIPGIGDLVSSGLSSVIIFKAYKQNVPKIVLFRMMINIMIDTLVGAIPIFGDLFDFVWKANAMNSKLLDSYHHNPEKTKEYSVVTTALFILIAALIVLGCITTIYLLVTFLISLV